MMMRSPHQRRGCPCQDTELLLSQLRTNIVHQEWLQDAIVDGVVLAVHGLDFCFGRLNGIEIKGQQ